MPRIFVTAFEPYDRWDKNSSWLTLVEFTKSLDTNAEVTTRLYPVDFSEVMRRLEQDLEANYDYALHLGQSPGSATLRLEAIGLNVGGDPHRSAESFRLLIPEGPVAYRSQLPLAQWSEMLRRDGIPAAVSYHAGTYLCNATLYLSHYLAERKGLQTQSTFIHVPLDTSQAASETKEIPNLPATVCAEALQRIVGELIKPGQIRDLEPA